MSKHKFTADRSNMAHNIKRALEDRRDYNAVEQDMIRNGHPERAKLHWHRRTGQ